MAIMQLMLMNLSTILEDEVKTYGKLLDLFREERNSIVRGEVDNLNDMVSKTEGLILKNKELEERRQTVMESLSKYFHLPAGELNISGLSKLVNEPFTSRYTGYRERLLIIIRELDEINKGNANLIKYALDLMNDSLKLFFSGEEDVPLYNREAGKVEDRCERTKILDRKA